MHQFERHIAHLSPGQRAFVFVCRVFGNQKLNARLHKLVNGFSHVRCTQTHSLQAFVVFHVQNAELWLYQLQIKMVENKSEVKK